MFILSTGYDFECEDSIVEPVVSGAMGQDREVSTRKGNPSHSLYKVCEVAPPRGRKQSSITFQYTMSMFFKNFLKPDEKE